MNHLHSLPCLRNRYLAMRHGHSLANQQGIIVSDPVNGCSGFGLSETGREQVRESLQCFGQLDADTVIVSSDFTRALETAMLVQQLAAVSSAPRSDVRLRERFFGALELGPDRAYPAVWQRDAQNADDSSERVESANCVMARVTALIVELEQRYANSTLLLVSHGDALQILQTAFAGRPACEHRQQEHLQTAELRSLDLS